MQVSAARSPEEAASVLSELIERGYDGTLLSRREGGETLHTVLLGPYLSEDRAQQIAREIRAETGRAVQVIVEP